jgi:hypothetical protein
MTLKANFALRAILVVALLCGMGVLPSRAESLALIEKGQSEYSVVIPAASDDAARDKAIGLAANRLQMNLQRVSGARQPIVSEEKLAADVLLGSNHTEEIALRAPADEALLLVPTAAPGTKPIKLNAA